MGKVIYHTAVSLDGFVAGPNDSPENGLGDGGEKLHEWYFKGSVEIPTSDGQLILKVFPESARVLQEVTGGIGAEIWGRRTFDFTQGWGGHPPLRPCFIVTHRAPQEWVRPDSPFIFVTDSVESAVRQAKAAAGGKDVAVATASIFQQALAAGLVDEIHLSMVPVMLGGGVRMFGLLPGPPVDLEILRVAEAPGVTHISYRVIK